MVESSKEVRAMVLVKLLALSLVLIIWCLVSAGLQSLFPVLSNAEVISAAAFILLVGVGVIIWLVRS